MNKEKVLNESLLEVTAMIEQLGGPSVTYSKVVGWIRDGVHHPLTGTKINLDGFKTEFGTWITSWEALDRWVECFADVLKKEGK